ncbi:outer envelope protein 80, chloroplastic [Quillaja saponaria]|uniref:Outer envelope protein 80, chloroplastic n=1 Tax=Quillaja saponaria TaxID=32244 RepID=A0AAD7QGA2_QUISA|nr:outer envelope protein 80, chloroplastic [Quillaja saponaria]
MVRNDDVCFTSSSVKIPLPPQPNPFHFRTIASQFTNTRNSVAQLIESFKTRSSFGKFNLKFAPFWCRPNEWAQSASQARETNSASRPPIFTDATVFGKSSLLCSASLSLIRSDGSAQSESGNQGREDDKVALIGKAPLLCSASLSLAQSDESTLADWEGRDNQQKGLSASRHDEERVLISEVLIRNKDGEVLGRKDLEMEALQALKACRPNSAITGREVQEDVHHIIHSGYFSSCMPVAVDTLDGIRLEFQVEPNQEFQGLVCEGANVLPVKFVEDAFRDGYGKVINLRRLDEVISSINGWYMERGLFAMVSDVEILSGGVLRLEVSEAEVNNISIRFLDLKTQITTKKGQVYSMLQGKRDVETVLTMGIMEDVSIIPQPADTDKVDLVMNVVERKSGGFSAGGGISSGITSGPFSGLIGSFAYSHRNVFGKNQKLNRTSRTIMVQNSRTPGIVHGNLPDDSSLTIHRVTTGIEFSRPITPEWSGTVGLNFQCAGVHDGQGNPIIRDYYSSPLTASGNNHDDMLLAKFESVYTGSGNHRSSMFAFNMEQGLPVFREWLIFNRVNSRARKSIEIGNFRLLLSLSGGHVVGHFSPYEAFAIGGTNSVRGYEEGAVGSGRSYVVGSGDISFPLFGPVEGALFADYGTDLGSGPSVPGDPAGTRLKPGSGYGYGFGIRVDSPLGPLRLEYAFSDKQAKRFHFGIGHRN